MRHRHGFTITEMLVSMALILFIMAILSEAFVQGLETFRQLKAVGDMDQKLHTAVTILRRDLQASHFDNTVTSASQRPVKLSTLQAPPAQGFFVIAQDVGSAPIAPSGVTIITTPQPGQAPATVTLMPPLPPELSKLGPNPPNNVLRLGGGKDQSGKDIPPMEVTVWQGQPPYNYTPGSNPIPISPAPAQGTTFQLAMWDVPNLITDGNDMIDLLPSYYSASYKLHFTVNLGNNMTNDPRVKLRRRENFFAAAAPATLPNGTPSPLIGTPPLFRPPFQDPNNYLSQKAEVCYRLVPQPGNPMTAPFPPGATNVDGLTGPQKLFSLYRHQVVVLDDADATTMNGLMSNPATAITLPVWQAQYSDFCWVPNDPYNNPGQPRFPNFKDLASPWYRSLAYAAFNPAPYPPGWDGSHLFPIVGPANLLGRGEAQPSLIGSDLLLTDVVSFSVRAMTNFTPPGPDPFVPIGYDSFGANSSMQIKALEITLRVWDQRTGKTRQVTIIQDM